MTATLEEKIAEDIVALCKYVSGKEAVAIDELPKNLQNSSTLARAVAKGYAEVGRRNYTELIVSATAKKDKAGQYVLDDNLRQVVTKEMKTVQDNDWSWTDLKGRKSLSATLAEDKALPEAAKLHIRLTTAGEAVA